MSKQVAILTVPELNEWVAKALGWERRLWGAITVWFDPNNEGRYRCHVSQWNPSENWAQGGPIIERTRIIVAPYLIIGAEDSGWKAGASGKGFEGFGPTPLIAAMRCLVASKFPDGVPDE